MCRNKAIAKALSLAGAMALLAGTAQAQPACVTCPSDAQATAVGAGLTVVRASNNQVVQPGQSVGACETLNVLGTVAYQPQVLIFQNGVAQTVTGSGFYGGTGTISVNNANPLSPFNVTPADMGTTTVGPAPCASTLLKGMNNLPYTVTAADVAAGSITFSFSYTGGHSLLGDCSLLVSGSAQFIVNVVGLPSCSIAPATTTVCEGGQASFTVSSTGPAAGGPFTFSWTGPNGFTATGPTATINPATLASAGVYTATVTDQFGCTSTCTATLNVNPNPTCTISGSNPVNCNSVGNVYTTTVLPAGGTVTHSWTITGNGTIVGATDGASVTVTAGASGSYTLTDSITRDTCPGSCTITVPITPCPPHITVYKQVVCELAGAVCDTFGANPATDNKSASGVTGATCPAFCYKITVINDGQVDLSGVTVTDPTISLSSCTFPSTLAIGASATCTVTGVQLCQNTDNTVTAQGQSVADSSAAGHVTSSDTAHVTVVPISVTCDVSLSSSFDMDGNATDNHVTLPADQQNASIALSITLHNPSTVDLSVSLSGLPALVDCATGASLPAPAPVTVPAGGDVTVAVGCFLASCPAGADITVTVVGTAVSSAAHPCIYDVNGNAVTTAASTCTASVTCQSPATCRVTGGGVLLPGEVEAGTCSQDVVTTVSGPTCNGADAVKITHGGQLGAPYSNPTCGNVAAFPQGDPCIRGQWEHVRHYQGKANPSTSVQVDNFHSNTPLGIFDSLQCACLPCCENPTAGGQIGNLCNPDDHKICGPEPRPAPANAIIFSGVGYIRTCVTSNQKGKGTLQPVIFRVYIEDRSEPGGQFPGGAKAPADVYCFQAWAINGQYDSAANIALRQAVATDSCNFINTYTQGSTPDANVIGAPLIEDCGALHTGNHQIHPSTSATCTTPTP